MNNDWILFYVKVQEIPCQPQMHLIYFLCIFLPSNAVNISDTLTYICSLFVIYSHDAVEVCVKRCSHWSFVINILLTQNTVNGLHRYNRWLRQNLQLNFEADFVHVENFVQRFQVFRLFTLKLMRCQAQISFQVNYLQCELDRRISFNCQYKLYYHADKRLNLFHN